MHGYLNPAILYLSDGGTRNPVNNRDERTGAREIPPIELSQLDITQYDGGTRNPVLYESTS